MKEVDLRRIALNSMELGVCALARGNYRNEFLTAQDACKSLNLVSEELRFSIVCDLIDLQAMVVQWKGVNVERGQEFEGPIMALAQNISNRIASCLPDAEREAGAGSEVGVEPEVGAGPEVIPPYSDCLKLPEVVMSGEYKCYIATAPLNSSGDIYHILAWVILMKRAHMSIPRILLTYDKEKANERVTASKINTHDQVNRMIFFASTLGYGQHFIGQYIATDAAHAGVRQARLRAYLEASSQDEPLCYIDQMASTVQIAKCFKKAGAPLVSQVLREGFSQRESAHFPEKYQERVDQYVDSVSMKIEQQNTEHKPILVFHVRYSSKTNSDLNIPANFMRKLMLAKREAGFFIVRILAGKQQGLKYDGDLEVAPFSKKRFRDGEWGDYSKHAHLGLLLMLQQCSRTRGVIGNTSGTLDLAAFIGLPVFNIHQFKEKFSYQECRLFFQMLFMSIGEYSTVSRDFTEVSQLDHWLSDFKPGLGKAVFSGKTGVDLTLEKLRTSGFHKLFFMQLFTGAEEVPYLPIPEAEETFLSLR